MGRWGGGGGGGASAAALGRRRRWGRREEEEARRGGRRACVGERESAWERERVRGREERGRRAATVNFSGVHLLCRLPLIPFAVSHGRQSYSGRRQRGGWGRGGMGREEGWGGTALPSAIPTFAVCQQTAKRWLMANIYFAISLLFTVCFLPTHGKEVLRRLLADGKDLADGKYRNSSSVSIHISLSLPLSLSLYLSIYLSLSPSLSLSRS